MSYSDVTEGMMLDWFFGLDTITEPATLYLALSTADPGETGSTIAEPGDTYARQPVGVGTDNWTRTAGSVVNDNVITFPEAGASWGTITHVALFSAESGGTFYGSGGLTQSQAIGDGQTLSIPVGDLAITLD